MKTFEELRDEAAKKHRRDYGGDCDIEKSYIEGCNFARDYFAKEIDRLKAIIAVSDSATGIMHQAAKIKELSAALIELATALRQVVVTSNRDEMKIIVFDTLNKYRDIIQAAKERVG
jgi:hypothetical protein